MTLIHRSLLRPVLGLVSVLCLATVPFAEAAPEPVRSEAVGQRVTENVPAIPPALLERLSHYQNTRQAMLGGWNRDGSLIVLTRFGDTSQAHRVSEPLGMREQLTFYREPVNVAVASAGGKPGFVFLRDEGGSEFWQLYWRDMETRETRLLSNGKRSRNEQPVLSSDGTQVAWGSTERNGADTDIWVADIASGKRRNVLAEGGAWYPLGFSPDGQRLLVMRYVSINESHPAEVDLRNGALQEFPLEGGKAAVAAAAYGPAGQGIFYLSDENSEFMQLRQRLPGKKGSRVLSSHIPWDVTLLAVDRQGQHLAFVANEDGVSRLHVLGLPDFRPLALPELPTGVIDTIDFDAEGKRLAFNLNRADAPSDIYVIEPGKTSLVRWTKSEVGDLDPDVFIEPTLVRYPTFDTVDGKPRTIPAFYYRPKGKGPFPVVVSIHGGPESQALPYFNARTQFLVNELNVAVLVPNVRGSAGYGKSYLLLDNGMKRKDSVKDIGSLLDWIARQPELDAKRVGVTGGSYGGYMVLASLVDYSDRIAAGIDIVGISDFVTFLKATESYRRDLRRAEYGDERDPAMHAFLTGIAPVRNAARIQRPLFVAQGANDPRVPASEARQIVDAVRGNGQDVWYLLFKDEGHGFQKKPNIDYFDAASVLFWQQHLLK